MIFNCTPDLSSAYELACAAIWHPALPADLSLALEQERLRQSVLLASASGPDIIVRRWCLSSLGDPAADGLHNEIWHLLEDEETLHAGWRQSFQIEPMVA